MDSYCVLGNPVEHSKSPWIHARFAELTGQSMTYGKRLIALDGFAAAMAELRSEGIKGCNITVPFKFLAAPLASQLSARARLAEACNVLSFDAEGIAADNTDGIGLVHDITGNANTPIAGRDVLLMGAGGAAAGVLGPVLECGPNRVVVANRSPEKARLLVARHADLAQKWAVNLEACALDAVPGAFDIVINGTASSLAGTGVPVPARVLRPGALAIDMMYGPAAQGFLDWAAQHGALPRDGLGMLVEQAAEAFAIWRGVRPPSTQVLDELRRSLG